MMVAHKDLFARQLTVAEWRAILETSDTRYEYHHGWLVAMAGGSADHSTIAINVTAELRAALINNPCRVYNSDMAVRYSALEYRFPDATVTCESHVRGSVREIEAPRIIIEVLSDSTEKEDRTAKFALARACTSVQEYILIATDSQMVEVYRRAEPRWTYQPYGPGESIDLESVGVTLSVDQLYLDSDVPRP